LTDPHTERAWPPRRGLPRNRQLAILAIAAVVIVGLFFLLPLVGRLFAPKPPPPPPAAPPGTFRATNEEWAGLGLATAQTIAFSPEDQTDGKIAANDNKTTLVYSPFTGRVTRVIAKIGDRIHAGSPLFAIEGSEFVQSQNDLVTAAAQVRLTKAAEARQEALYKENGAALKDLEQSQADLATAEINLAAARNRLRVLGKSAAEVAAVERGVVERGMSSETIVAAPIGGVVTQKSVGVGQNLASVANNGGSTPAYSISDLSTVWLIGNLREADAPHARLGQTVQVRVNALPDRVFTARLNYIASAVDPTTRRVTVRAEIPNPGGELLPEMFATFTLITGAATPSVGVPEQGVIYEGDQARVWVARAGHLLQLRQVKAGQTTGGMVQVLAGLSAGDQVVTNGALFIDRASKGD
jgi:cobalt-zinc-cadmium efflux system membrane fusion protein